ncbi:unnamed protein product [Leuciscus chuanchicus]
MGDGDGGGSRLTNKTKADCEEDHPPRLAQTQTQSDILRPTGLAGGGRAGTVGLNGTGLSEFLSGVPVNGLPCRP